MINKIPIQLFHEELYLYTCRLCFKYDLHIKDIAMNSSQTIITQYLHPTNFHDLTEVRHTFSNEGLNKELDYDNRTT